MLFTFVVVIVVARVCGWVFQKCKQPPVMGEVLGGRGDARDRIHACCAGCALERIDRD